MKSGLPFTALVNKEIYDSPIGTLAAMLTIIAGIITIIKALSTKKSNTTGNIYKAMGISEFLMFFFAIKIPLNRIPNITKTDVGFIVFIVITSSTASFFLGNIFLKVVNTPANSASLFYKPTGENFNLSLQAATEAVALETDKAWTITPHECKNPQELPLVPSVGLTRLICEVFEKKDYQLDVTKQIKKFEKDKPVIYILLSVIQFSFLWMLISLILSLYYKKRIRTYIIKQHEKASSYVM